MYERGLTHLLHSPLWDQVSSVRILWITMCVLADESGMVYGTDVCFARKAVLTIEQTRQALNILDPINAKHLSIPLDGFAVERLSGSDWRLVCGWEGRP